MSTPTFWQIARVYADECVLWLKTEWRLHFWVGVAAVLVSLWLAHRWSDPTLLARSGALMTITGAIMTYRAFIRGRENAFLRDTGRADRPAFKVWNPYASRDEAKAEDQKAFRWGLISFVVGTLIWAYGDLAFSRKAPDQRSHRNASTMSCSIPVSAVRHG